MSSRRLLWIAVILAVGVVAALWMARPWLFRAMAQWLDVGERPRQADYVLVLNGDEGTRPLVAAAIMKAGLARKALIVETASDMRPADLSLTPCHEINREVLLRRGIADADISILPGAATTTYDEARALAAFLSERPTSRVLVVTSDFHTRRSRWVFARALGSRAGDVSFVSAPSDGFNRDLWWQDELGMVTVFTEYPKLVFYLIRYGYVVYWLAACAVLAVVAQLLIPTLPMTQVQPTNMAVPAEFA